jgi:tRNA-2-methylthio-N6-dimethylallyladenosine synthase
MYTVALYDDMLARIRETVPGASVSSDFIVGFCGETEEDFELSCELVRECRFKNSFIFKYSERPGTTGSELYADDVPEDVKRRRNNELLAIQNQISEEDNQPFLGRLVDVLVEGPSKSAERSRATGILPVPNPEQTHTSGLTGNMPVAHETMQLVGRTMCDRIVVFDGNPRQIGQVLPISVYDANAHTLFGAVVTQHVGPELFTLSV